MKKLFRLLMFSGAFISLIFLLNCTGDEVAKKNLCGDDLEIKKYACQAGTCYFVEAPDDIDFDFTVKMTFIPKAGGENVVRTYNSTSLLIGYVLPSGIWEQNFGYDPSIPILNNGSDEIIQGAHYNTTFYEYPSFEIELLGECPTETKVIDADDIQEGVEPFAPSFLASPEVDAGDPLNIYLFSNNPKATIILSISTSLGETESLTLTRLGESSLYSGTINTSLSNINGTNNDGTIGAENGTTVTISYTDALDQDGNTVTISLIVTMGGETAPTCSDGIQNGDENGVDCGGTNCSACATCEDGIQNGDEDGVDCGGSNCDACATCSDGIQNGDETSVDCGGSNCSACEVGDAVTFENTTYVITDASYLDYPFDGKEYILFTLSRYENEMQVFTADIEIVATTITSETYQFGDADYGVTGSIGLNNTPDYATINGGYVVVVITPLGDYALELHLSTDKGAFTGSYTVPYGL